LTRETLTDLTGHFAAGGTAKPGHYDVTISVACPSTGKVLRVFRHDRQETHEVTIVLRSQQEGSAPDSNQISQQPLN